MQRRKNKVEKTTKKSLIPQGMDMKGTIGFVVRIHSGRNSSTEIKKDLCDLGLSKKYQGIFCKLDRDGIAKLKPLDAYLG